MTEPGLALETVTGARRTLTVVVPVRLNRTPGADSGWARGPYPFELGSRRTDTATRSRYFAPAAARVLYGTPDSPRRWHRPLSVSHDGLHLVGMELLRTATARNAQHALAVLHFALDRPLLPVLRAIGHRLTAGPEPLTGPLDPRRSSTGSPKYATEPAPSPSPAPTPSPS